VGDRLFRQPAGRSFVPQPEWRWPGPPPRTKSVWDISIRGRRPGRSSTCETITPESWRVALWLDDSGRCPEKSGAMRVSAFIEPCLPSPADHLPSGPDWIHEIKLDGFRMMVRRDRRSAPRSTPPRASATSRRGSRRRGSSASLYRSARRTTTVLPRRRCRFRRHRRRRWRGRALRAERFRSP
jgi:hypothetical protein